MTIREWLQKMADANTSNQVDDAQMQGLLRKINFPKAIVTCGLVYLEGSGEPGDIHTVAKTILGIAKKGEVKS